MGKIARSSRQHRVRTPRRQATGGSTSKVRETRAATPDARGALADLAVQLHQRAWATQFESLGMDAGLRLAIEARVADFSATLRGLVQSGAYFQATGMFARDSEAELQFLQAALPQMSEADRAACLSEAWARGLFGAQAIDDAGRPKVSLQALRNMFRGAGPLRISAGEALFHGRKGAIAVYRGFGLRRHSVAGVARGARGLEWSVRRDVAACRALRAATEGFIPVAVSASAPPAAVLAYFGELHGGECIIDATCLSAIRETRITSADRAAYAKLREGR